MTTIRKLLGFTKHMSPFHMAAAWGLVRNEVKAQLPDDLISALDALAVSVAAQKAATEAYNAVKKLLDTNTVVSAGSIVPPTPASITVAAGIVATEIAEAAIAAPGKAVKSTVNLIDVILDTEIPGT